MTAPHGNIPAMTLRRSTPIALTALVFLAACGSDGTLPGGSGEGGTGAIGTPGAGGTGNGPGSTGEGGSGNATSGNGGSGGEDPLAGCPRVKVVVEPGLVLNVRPDPSTSGAPVGELPNNAIADVVEIVTGEAVDGNTTWYRINYGDIDGYVSGFFAVCTMEEAPELTAPDAWYLPLECGLTTTVTQGNNGTTSHNGISAYAFDFSLGLNSPFMAMADGVVAFVYADTGPGDPCYNGGGPECNPYTNLVSLLHGDGTRTIYKHLNEVHVGLGQFVPRGTPVGLSGSTGWSTGRHAHVARIENCGTATCQSVPLAFADVPGDGVPVTGQSVTSGNCP